MDCIRMIGYDAVHPSDFVYDMPEEHGHYLLILTHTPLRFRKNGVERVYPARHAAIFSPDSPIHYGACEASYSNDWMIFDSDEPYVTQFALLFQKLRAGLDLPGDTDYRLELTALRRRIMSQPGRNWSVSEMAEQLHISVGYLHLLYKRQFGVSCIDDVIESRVRQARDYLSHTQLRIQEIAALCGYNSAEHFSRQFHRQCGMSPGEYRRAATSSEPG